MLNYTCEVTCFGAGWAPCRHKTPTHAVPALPLGRRHSKPPKTVGAVCASAAERAPSSLPRLQTSILGGRGVEPSGVWRTRADVCGRHYHDRGPGPSEQGTEFAVSGSGEAAAKTASPAIAEGSAATIGGAKTEERQSARRRRSSVTGPVICAGFLRTPDFLSAVSEANSEKAERDDRSG